MHNINRSAYPVQRREVVMEGTDMRVTVQHLAAGQSVPWHYHSQTTDAIFCLEGTLVVETRAPRAEHLLKPGDSFTVPPMTAHHVHGLADGPCRFLIVQGIGDFDFQEVG